MLSLATIRDQRMKHPSANPPPNSDAPATSDGQPSANANQTGHEPSAAGSQRSRNARELTTTEVAEQIQQALSGLRFGHVTITVQDGVVVQIERIEKRRLR